MEYTTIVNILLIGLLIYFVFDRFKPVKGLQHLSQKDVEMKMKNSKEVVLIDVRQPYEFNSNHLPGAINVPLSSLRRGKGEVPVDKEIILYCQTGIRSKQAANLIKKKYNPQVLSHLAGGIFAWKGQTVGRKSKKGK
ncbi:rhodanese-like domain-containing protein [Bacillus timonensis]|nr:rhodanese-like domain-containing protein [Bacillus timonensis]